MAAPEASKPSLPEHLMHKNRLQEYTQRSAIPLPIYQTVNEGSPHAPRFRSTVLVDGAAYKSVQTFSHRKEAEQDVAKHALNCISQKIKNEGCPLIIQDTIFCKSILNEFAVKMNLEMPSYTTSQSEGLLPVFVSSLVFNGIKYTGAAGKNKKEAEQLAARSVIQSIMGKSGSGTCLSQIIKSKAKLYAAMHRTEDPGVSTSKGKEVEVHLGVEKFPMPACPGTSQGQLTMVPVPHPPIREFKKPKHEHLTEASGGVAGAYEPVPDAYHLHQNQTQNEVTLVQPSAVCHNSHGTVVDTSVGSKRSRKNKKGGQKRVRSDEQSQTAMLPINQSASCSVAQ